MQSKSKQLVRSTWQQVVPVAGHAAELFYRRLFELDAELRPLFAGVDLEAQKTSLVQALSAVVDGLDEIDRLLPRLEALGRRHVAYGATAEHYDTVGAALLWTLEQGLGDAWSEAARAAWSDAYGLVAGAMQGAAAEVPPAASSSGDEQQQYMPGLAFSPGFGN